MHIHMPMYNVYACISHCAQTMTPFCNTDIFMQNICKYYVYIVKNLEKMFRRSSKIRAGFHKKIVQDVSREIFFLEDHTCIHREHIPLFLENRFYEQDLTKFSSHLSEDKI